MTNKRFDYRQLDDLVHSRLRLCLLLMLEARGESAFAEIKEALAATDGNLITHLRKLADAGCIRASKESRRTTYRLTPLGRRNLRRYRRTVAGLLDSEEGDRPG